VIITQNALLLNRRICEQVNCILYLATEVSVCVCVCVCVCEAMS